MRKATRRQWLKASLGLGAYGLLEGAGFWGRNVSHASVQPGAPSRFLRLYVPGGWSPFYQFCPFSPTEIEAIIPTASHPFGQDPVFYSASQVNNLDGSGNALDPVGFPRLRVPRTWNESALSVGQPADNNANGWAWSEHELWKYCSVVHGVDMGTMSHRSALISMLTGRATTNFSVPSLGSWVAASVGEVLGEQRPLGSVVLSRRLMMPSAGLGADGAPTRLAGIESLQNGWSEQLDQVWDGLKSYWKASIGLFRYGDGHHIGEQ